MSYTEDQIENIIEWAREIIQLDEIDYHSRENSITHVNRKMNRKDLIRVIRQLQNKPSEY